MRAMLLHCACCELGGDAVEDLKPASAARCSHATAAATAATARLYEHMIMLMMKMLVLMHDVL